MEKRCTTINKIDNLNVHGYLEICFNLHVFSDFFQTTFVFSCTILLIRRAKNVLVTSLIKDAVIHTFCNEVRGTQKDFVTFIAISSMLCVKGLS
jgi:hypothetical protein